MSRLFLDQSSSYNNESLGTPFHRSLKVAAKLLSYIFHPVFVPVYIISFLLFVEPFLFVGYYHKQKLLVFIQSVLMYFFLPVVSILLLRALKFIPSIQLKHQKDRIIPFIICNIWYFWMWYVWRNLPQIPHPLVVFAMSIFLASSIGMLFNIYMKISMHAIAIGTALTFLCVVFLQFNKGFALYVCIALLMGGMVCSSRLILAAHHPSEVYWGIATGVLSVVVAHIIV